MHDYTWLKGEFVWKESAKPGYTWYNGSMKRLRLGDKVDLDAPFVNITEPVGSIMDPSSKIAPFKFMEGTMAADFEHRTLMVPHLFPQDKEDPTAYWKHLGWQKAYTTGMQAAHLPYSGKYKWINTRM